MSSTDTNDSSNISQEKINMEDHNMNLTIKCEKPEIIKVLHKNLPNVNLLLESKYGKTEKDYFLRDTLICFTMNFFLPFSGYIYFCLKNYKMRRKLPTFLLSTIPILLWIGFFIYLIVYFTIIKPAMEDLEKKGI